MPSGRVVIVQSPEGVLLVRMEKLAGVPVSDVFEQCLYLVGSGTVNDRKADEMAQGIRACVRCTATAFGRRPGSLASHVRCRQAACAGRAGTPRKHGYYVSVVSRKP